MKSYMTLDQWKLNSKIEKDLTISNNIEKLLHSDLTNELTVMFLHPNDVIYDKRNIYCCKVKCPNFNTRCYCPPQSFRLRNSIKNKNLVVILAKTYDFSELSHFKNHPSDFNEDYLYKKRVFVRRWAQSHFYKLIKNIVRFWGDYSKDLFACGFSLGKCIKCFSNANEKHYKNCVPMPSPEALGINVQKTLEQLDYHINFGVQKKMTKISMIFTNILNNTNYIYKRYNGDDKPFRDGQSENLNILRDLEKRFKNTEFKEIKISDFLSKLKEEFSWIKNWNKGVLWKTKSRAKKKIKDEIHNFIFMKNFCFALDLTIEDIFKEILSFDGIELIS